VKFVVKLPNLRPYFTKIIKNESNSLILVTHIGFKANIGARAIVLSTAKSSRLSIIGG
jgi:hypothetical protein